MRYHIKVARKTVRKTSQIPFADSLVEKKKT